MSLGAPRIYYTGKRVGSAWRGSTVVWPLCRRKRRDRTCGRSRVAKEGADVAVQFNRGKAAAEAVAKNIGAKGRRGLAIPADVTDREACRTLRDEAVRALAP